MAIFYENILQHRFRRINVLRIASSY